MVREANSRIRRLYSESTICFLFFSDMKTAKVEYYVAELYWGQGIGKSAVKQLCEYVFKIRI
ncbi:GNAT family N-acetyltransferase [Bacteroides congonensis]|uniref:GNAT family N-acetyltransferase n=1 Tax=Bacteroides congonensis TaxID=1871006 RepID=UPI00373FDDAF